MKDNGLAALGDSIVNFLYSMALSIRLGAPKGVKVKSSYLAAALSEANLRRYLPSRIDRHMKADAAEALIAYAWLSGYISIEETVKLLSEHEDAIEAFSHLLRRIESSFGGRNKFNK